MSKVIQSREQVIVNIDPQRRCYNGANFSEAVVWTAWTDLEDMAYLKPGADVNERVEFWRGLSEYAAKERRHKHTTEYRIIERETP